MRPRGSGLSGHFEKSQEVLRAVLESPQGIVIFALDKAYRYLAFNENHARTMKHIWGVTLNVGDDMLEHIKREDDREKARRNFDRALAGESFTLYEEYGDELLDRRHYEDVYSPIRDEEGRVIGLTVYLTDITERRRAELELQSYRTRLEELVEERTAQLEAAHEQLLHVQKLESLGVLAGGIAHDFNNLLAVILGRAELASGLLPPDSAVRPHLAIVQNTALEARMLTKQLLGYSGKGKVMVQLLDLDELIESMMPLLRASISSAVTLSFRRGEHAPVVEADATQLRQVLLNLVTNAAEAIGDRVGSVDIRTSHVSLDAVEVQRLAPQPRIGAGQYVRLTVEDSGCGMDERVRAKLFDPFFTTKFSGRGLGLAAVLGIVSSHRGGIAVSSQVGQGSSLMVYLPRAEGAPAALSQAKRERTPCEQSATILVIDDESAVRSIIAVNLELEGHRVITAEGGEQACELYRQRAGEISLVLLDLTMPQMNGEQTLRALQAIDPQVAVLVMTGYAEDDVRERFRPDELAGFLAKPFSRQELLSAVALALATASR